MATKLPASTPMCCVRINFQSFLMPMTKGTQLLTLLQGAVECKEDYLLHDRAYIMGEQPDIELMTFKPSQVRRSATPGKDGEPLALENNPSRRARF